jgi:hypothetical protein
MRMEDITAVRLDEFIRCAAIGVTLIHFQGKTPMRDTQKLCNYAKLLHNKTSYYLHAQ